MYGMCKAIFVILLFSIPCIDTQYSAQVQHSDTRSFSKIKVNGHTTNILQTQIVNKNYFPRYYLGAMPLHSVESKLNEYSDNVVESRSTRERDHTPININRLDFYQLLKKLIQSSRNGLYLLIGNLAVGDSVYGT
jgi:hypothetical protein